MTTAPSQVVAIEIEGHQFSVFGDEPRVRDLDFAMWLGFKHPHRIKELIRNQRAGGLLDENEVVTVAVETGPKGGRPGITYWLSHTGAVKIAAKSEGPRATAILREVVRVWDLVRRRVLDMKAAPVTGCTTQPATATTRSARRPNQWTPDIALATLFLEDAAHQVDSVQRQWSLIRAAEEASGEALQHRWPAVKEAAKQDLRPWCEGSRTLVARIAQRLPRLRAAHGLGVEDLARLSGRSAKRIREIEAGRGAPSMETALAFAHVLGCPVEELVADAA